MSEAVSVPLEQLTRMAIEHWRLVGAFQNGTGRGNGEAQVRHALRKMGEVLGGMGLEARSLNGVPYDPGLSVRVVDRVAVPSVQKGVEVISETIAPLVLFEGRVVKSAEVVLAVGDGV